MSLVVDAAALALLMIVAGAHATAPFRLPAATPGAREAWGLGALPALLAAIAVAATWIAWQPDAALAAGLTSWDMGSTGFRLLLVLLPALVLGDLVAAIGRRRMEPVAWLTIGLLGVLGAAGMSLVLEEIRLGEGPGQPTGMLLLAAGCRLAVTFGLGEIVAPGRPRWAPPAAVALLVYPLLLPTQLRGALNPLQEGLTLAAAVALLALCRWAPPRLRRPALAGGALVTCLFLARIAQLSHELALAPMPPTPPLPIP